mgnify:CR=1 FL=1
MAQTLSLDPFSLVRGLVAQLEKSVNEYSGPVMKSDGFVKGTHKAMSAAMVAKKLSQELSQRSFEVLNIPSRADVIALAHQLQAIEDRMIGMQTTLDRLAGGGARSALPAPSRTRKPPAPIVEVAAAPAPAAKRTRKAKS